MTFFKSENPDDRYFMFKEMQAETQGVGDQQATVKAKALLQGLVVTGAFSSLKCFVLTLQPALGGFICPPVTVHIRHKDSKSSCLVICNKYQALYK